MQPTAFDRCDPRELPDRSKYQLHDVVAGEQNADLKGCRAQLFRKVRQDRDDDTKAQHGEKSNQEQEGKVLLIHGKYLFSHEISLHENLLTFSTLREGSREVKRAAWACSPHPCYNRKERRIVQKVVKYISMRC